MLRKIIMFLGLFVALLPYLGLPRVIDNWLFTASGLFIFFLLVFSKRTKVMHLHVADQESSQDVKVHAQGVPPSEEGEMDARALHVAHKDTAVEHRVEIISPVAENAHDLRHAHKDHEEEKSQTSQVKTKKKKSPAHESQLHG